MTNFNGYPAIDTTITDLEPGHTPRYPAWTMAIGAAAMGGGIRRTSFGEGEAIEESGSYTPQVLSRQPDVL